MNNSTTNHYSHKLEFNLNKIPAKVSDRTSWRFLLPGIVFGALLFLLGLYEMLNVFNYTNQNVAEIVPLEALPNYKPIFDPIIFDIIFMIVGFGIIAASVGSYLRYRKFIFDGKKMMIGDRSVWGKKRIAKESIRNYLGVRFRVAFYRYGLVNSNKSCI